MSTFQKKKNIHFLWGFSIVLLFGGEVQSIVVAGKSLHVYWTLAQKKSLNTSAENFHPLLFLRHFDLPI